MNHTEFDIKMVDSHPNFTNKVKCWICSWFGLVNAFLRALALIFKVRKVCSSSFGLLGPTSVRYRGIAVFMKFIIISEAFSSPPFHLVCTLLASREPRAWHIWVPRNPHREREASIELCVRSKKKWWSSVCALGVTMGFSLLLLVRLLLSSCSRRGSLLCTSCGHELILYPVAKKTSFDF